LAHGLNERGVSTFVERLPEVGEATFPSGVGSIHWLSVHHGVVDAA
jgi:hypothetical protein